MLRLEELRSQIHTVMLGAVMARAQGAEVSFPDPEQLRADFDTALAAAPESVADPKKYLFMQAMGLR